MLFRQLTYGPDGCASYLIGCSQGGEAVVVDPLASLGAVAYLAAAADLGLTIRYVVDTHTHADHLSAGRALAAAAKAPYCLSRAAGALVNFPFHALDHDDCLRVGNVEARVLATPGHTPDSVCLLVTDHGRSAEPWFVLTGDTLFVGDVGRPDLLVGDQAIDVCSEGERAERLFRSIQDRLLTLPDHLEVYPGHFGGSACGGVHMSGKAATTVGFERRHNLALQQADAAAFAAFVRRTATPPPPRYEAVKRQNIAAGAHEQAAPGLDPQDVQARVATGAVPLDLRSPATAAAAHVPGAILLPFGSQDLVRRAEQVLARDETYVLVVESDLLGPVARELLAAAGYRVAGHLAGGMPAWQAAGLPTADIPLVTVAELQPGVAAGNLHALDVRDESEYGRGHIPGARLLPHTEVRRRAAELDRAAHWHLVCNSQTRSGMAASILRRLGFAHVSIVFGGTPAWTEAGYPMER